MLDAFGLINMNGRVYDPLVARFLSPDNYVQLPDNSQGFNRYSYCLNNPFMYTDKDGKFWNLVIGAIIGGTINWMAHGAEFSWEGLGYFGIGAAAGALGAGVGAGVSAAIAGSGATGVAGASFASGFMGTSTAISTGFSAGLISGAAGGFTGGFINGFGNTAMKPDNDFIDMLNGGLTDGWKGAAFGGIAGGIFGGIDAVNHDRNFFTGAGKQEVVFTIEKNGEVRIIDIKDYKGDNVSKAISKNFSTKVLTDNSTLQSDGLYHYKYTIPKELNGITPTLRGPQPIIKATTTKNLISFTTLYPMKSVTLYGWRFHSNPLNSFSDLFHSRLINWPW